MEQEIIFPQTEDKNYRKLGWIVLGLFISIFVIWSSFAPLSSAVSSSGKVIVSSKNKIIQHLDGGIVKSILVNDGDTVKANQILIELDKTQSKAQLDIYLSQYYGALALESRLIAERDNKAIIQFNEELLTIEDTVNKSIIIAGQNLEFETRKRQVNEEKNILNQKIAQLQSQIEGLKSIIDSKKVLSNSYKDEIAEWEILYKEQLIDKIKLRDIKREKIKIDGEIANGKADISQSYSQISENKAQILNITNKFSTDVISQLRETQTKISDLKARVDALRDTLNKTTITSPSEGIIANLEVHTIGGIIAPGHNIMEVVPTGNPLIIEATVPSTEAINVFNNLKVEIRFPSFAHIKTLNVVEGNVIFVAPDATVDEKTQNSYYKVKVEVTEKGKRELIANNLVLQAGMPADVMIIINNHTFADYIIEPIKNISRKAFNEK